MKKRSKPTRKLTKRTRAQKRIQYYQDLEDILDEMATKWAFRAEKFERLRSGGHGF